MKALTYIRHLNHYSMAKNKHIGLLIPICMLFNVNATHLQLLLQVGGFLLLYRKLCNKKVEITV